MARSQSAVDTRRMVPPSGIETVEYPIDSDIAGREGEVELDAEVRPAMKPIRTPFLVLTFTSLLAVGCTGKSEPSGGTPGLASGSGSTTVSSAAAGPSLDLKALNAMVPASLRSELSFEAFRIPGRVSNVPDIEGVRPKGWQPMFPNEPEPTHFRSGENTWTVSMDCNGVCTARAWEPELTKALFTPGASDTVLERESAPGRALLATSSTGGSVTISAAEWKDKQSHYALCRVELSPKYKDARLAFEKACDSLRVHWK
jgi:hypothetical protein